ncbi:aspartate 4-decarboxylase [Pedobacter sp.]|uniref:aspartate 4-decarboxylase n=1 Tax=Pedobacter sp. TaxID=1411316 RepID=UPI003D7FAFF4
MTIPISKIKTSREVQKKLQTMSPFEIKDELIHLANEAAQKSTGQMLNAGRGNPNWIATVPREAFFLFGQFALGECRRVMDVEGGMAGTAEDKTGIAERFEIFLKEVKSSPALDLLKDTFEYGLKQHKFEPDAFVREMVESVIGFNYPVPDRMLRHMEPIVQDYMLKEMCNGKPPKGNYDLFAVEGGTAAMCYIFDSLIKNHLVKKGEKIGLLVPTFTPYIEIPHLDQYDFEVINIVASKTAKNGFHTWHYPESELDKLKDPDIKIAFVVNPSNPPSVAFPLKSLKYISDIVKNHNPGLMVITDDVYGTFVPGFVSLMAALPYNTLTVYSFSKYFGCTGWRLGVIALHEKNIFDDKIAALGDRQKKSLRKRYEIITLAPEKLKFIDRMVADSRQVALNHTAGLSLPQQFQMMLFASFSLHDKNDTYRKLTRDLVGTRLKLLWEGMGVDIVPDPMRAGYYSGIDVMVGALHFYGPELAQWLEEHFEPLDVVFRLAEKTSIVLLNGGGFAAPKWSIRVSLANLPTDNYKVIGQKIREILLEYVDAWEKSKKK